MWRKISQRLAPKGACLLCSRRLTGREALCVGCDEDLSRLESPCPQCGNEGAGGQRCGECLRHSPAYDATIAAFRYAEPVSWMIQRFKFNQKLAYGRALGEALAAEVRRRAALELPEAVIPVPLHARRQRERGFNQALEIARIVARELQVPLESGRVTRVRVTEEQSTLDANARASNIRGAFNVTQMPWRRVAIVDDVMTTGNTVAELARSLKRAGCEHVQVWVAARAER